MHGSETSLFTAILVASIVMLVVVIFFTVTIIQQQRKNLALYKAKLVAEITTLEKERSRIAEDLHDELGPVLAGIKLKLNSLDELPPNDQQTLESVHHNINGLIHRMKDISNDLMPVVLMKKGLLKALENSIEEINRLGRITIQLVSPELPKLENIIQINLYRICQEIIANTLKHAEASMLEMSFAIEKNKLVLQTRDNGKGFQHSSAMQKEQGLGLRNLLNRTEMTGGVLFVDSLPGKGTMYRIEIPLYI